MIVWFLMNFVGENEVSDPDLAVQLWRVAVSLIEDEVTGMPVQRCGLGLLGRFASLVTACPGALTDEVRECARTGYRRTSSPFLTPLSLVAAAL